MNRTDKKYTGLRIVGEMLDTADVIRRFDFDRLADVAAEIKKVGRLMLTGEGSSRLFPAKNAICQALRLGVDCEIQSAGSIQAAEYDLTTFAVFAASNSGKTKEIVSVLERLRDRGHPYRYALTANAGTPLCEYAARSFILHCGTEQAVAATKSVIEQTLFYHALVSHLVGKTDLGDKLDTLADHLQSVLEADIDPAIVEKIAAAPTVYWAGRDTGVAEELALKTNETIRSPSRYLEGSTAIHGIQEVMNVKDVLVWVSPFPEMTAKFREVIADGVGTTIIAIHTDDTPFPTIRIPGDPDLLGYCELAAGWSVLVEAGLAMNIDIDNPTRVNKVAYEYKK